MTEQDAVGNNRVECWGPCDNEARFWWYDHPEDTWRPVCAPDLASIKPGIDAASWLEAGLARPLESGKGKSDPLMPPFEGDPKMLKEICEFMEWSQEGEDGS